jgi:hypothetical protein
LEKKVHIMSMSWTIEGGDPGNEKHLERLSKAIKDAANGETIMYCSARDKGEDERKDVKPYPAASDTLKLKRVGAAMASGEKSTWTDAGAVDYLLPGVFSLKRESGEQAYNTNDRDSFDGSSAATALAAGLAALVLLCFEAVERKLDEFRTPERMDALFSALQSKSSKYIQVSRLLDVVKEGSRESADVAAMKVVEECRALVRSSAAFRK